MEPVNQDLNLVLANRLVFTNQRQGADPDSSDAAGDNYISLPDVFFWQRNDLVSLLNYYENKFKRSHVSIKNEGMFPD